MIKVYLLSFFAVCSLLFSIFFETFAGGPNSRHAAGVRSETGELSINFNLKSAKKTIELLRKKAVTDQELESWLKLPGTSALITKVKSCPDTAISAIRKVISGKLLTPHEQRFQFDLIYSEIDQISAIVPQLEEEGAMTTDSLEKDLMKYFPAVDND